MSHLKRFALLPGIVATAVVCLTLATARADYHYRYTTIDSTAEPGTADPQYVYINDAGDLTESGVNEGHYYASIRYHNGKWINLTIPGGTDFLADNFNNRGQTSVYYFNDDDNIPHTAIYDHGKVWSVPDNAGNVGGGVWCINDWGTLTGEFVNADGSTDEGYIQNGASSALFAHPGTDVIQTVAAYINDREDIVGFDSLIDGTVHGFLKLGSAFLPIAEPAGYTESAAFAINNLGDIVGEFFNSAKFEGFVIHNGVTTIVNFPNSTGTRAMGINDLGQITGIYKDAKGKHHAFLATPVP